MSWLTGGAAAVQETEDFEEWVIPCFDDVLEKWVELGLVGANERQVFWAEDVAGAKHYFDVVGEESGEEDEDHDPDGDVSGDGG